MLGLGVARSNAVAGLINPVQECGGWVSVENVCGTSLMLSEEVAKQIEEEEDAQIK